MIEPKKPPYGSTKVDPDKTKGQITKLLRDYGCEAIQWTEDFRINSIELKFIVETEIQGVKKQIAIHVIPPIIYQSRRRWNPKGFYEKVNAPNFAQSMRLLYWWLKSKLEAVAYGLSSVEKEFLSQVMVSLPDGSSTTVGETMSKAIIDNRLPEIAQEFKQLPKIPEDAKVIEVERE
jgi:hypothetical protein